MGPLAARAVALSLGIWLAASGLPLARTPQQSSDQADTATEEDTDPGWPRVIEGDGETLTVYTPQIDSFDGTHLEARAAVEVTSDDSEQSHYGVVWITAQTQVDKEKQLVYFDSIEVTNASFPGSEDKVEPYLKLLRENAVQPYPIALARIEANLAVNQSGRKQSVPVKSDPPRIIWSTVPAILILIDGDPALRPVEGSGLQRVINTRALILRDDASGRFFFPIAGTWIEARAINGPWSRSASVPPAAEQIRASIAKEQEDAQVEVDLLDDPGDDVKQLLSQGGLPAIHVSTSEAELLVTRGRPQLSPIQNTKILYVTNSDDDIFVDVATQDYFVPLSGRWFRARRLEGPWTFVSGDRLPPDFKRIPEENPKGKVLAAVAGTPEAEQAVIANQIPQTAQIDRSEVRLETRYDGDPQFEPTDDTTGLQYAFNSPTPVIRINPQTFYAVDNGVWFTSSSPNGPWIVADTIPPVIYSMPPSSPIYYVTYVRVFRSTPQFVWCGFTPGYLGTFGAPWGSVVFGTGWRYRPWIRRVWIGAPWTWGFGVSIRWYRGFGWSAGWGPRPWRPWWGPVGWGWGRPPRPPMGPPMGPRPPGWRPGPGRPWAGGSINRVNVYRRLPPNAVRPMVRPRPPSSQLRPSRPGGPGSRPQPGPGVRPGGPATRPQPGGPSTRPQPGRPGGRPSTRPSRPNDIYAGTDGNVYRPRPGGGWDQNTGGNRWQQARPAPGPSRPGPSGPSTGPSGPSTRPAPAPPPSGPSTRPAPSRPSGPPTYSRDVQDQLSRDRRGREMGERQMSPPPQRPAPPTRGAPPRR